MQVNWSEALGLGHTGVVTGLLSGGGCKCNRIKMRMFGQCNLVRVLMLLAMCLPDFFSGSKKCVIFMGTGN